MTERSIMIVDDDNDSRAMVKTILVNGGYQVEECASGPVALERLKSCDPALILLDVMMPEMSGYEVLERLRQDPKTQNIPVVMLTARSDSEDVFTAYKDYSVDYYITKPFTTRQLLSGIKLVLS